MYNFSKSKAEEIYSVFKALVPVLPKDELTKLIITHAIELNTASQNIESLRLLMNKTSSKCPEYPVAMTMNGVGTSLGLQLIA